jgi:transmembrane sensor
MEDLLIKYVTGEATREEMAQVERWLEADAANRRLYEEYKTLWMLSRQTATRESAEPADTREAWGRFRSMAIARSGGGIVGEKRIRLGGRGWMRVAATVAGTLILGAGGYLIWINHRPDGKITPVAAMVAKTPPTVKSGKVLVAARLRTDTLQDGTVVTLNRGSSLAIVEDMAGDPAGGSVEKGLTVRLRGEGFFSVRHDPARAFVVQLGAVAIKVLGTSFEVSGDGIDSMEIVVETGAVRVGDRMTVRAGERLTMIGKGIWKIGPNSDKLYNYYLGRPLVCDSTPLRRLVEVLNRVVDTPIVLGRKELGDLPLTTVFRGKSPDRILEVVALTFNLSIVRRGSAIILQ